MTWGCPYFSVFLCVADRREMREGWGRSEIIPRQKAWSSSHSILSASAHAAHKFPSPTKLFKVFWIFFGGLKCVGQSFTFAFIMSCRSCACVELLRVYSQLHIQFFKVTRAIF
jgi:hypothetical protein